MRKIIISAGHTNVPGKDRGAMGNGYVEGALTVEFRDLIVQAIKCIDHKAKVIIDSNANALSHSITYFRDLVDKDSIVVDIHWNASTPRATGTETFVPSNPSQDELALANDISEQISKTLQIPKRGQFRGIHGVKSESESHHGRLGWMKIIGINVLIEVCFITNVDDMQKYEDNKVQLSKEIAQILYDAANEIDDRDSSEVWHTVVRGDTLSGLARQYNTSQLAIMHLNNLTTSTIYLGKKLRIK